MGKFREYSLQYIGNMDETPVWLEMPGNWTLDYVGSPPVSVSSVGQHNTIGDGTTLLPIVLLPGVRPPKMEDVPTAAHVWYRPIMVKQGSDDNLAESDSGAKYSAQTIEWV